MGARLSYRGYASALAYLLRPHTAIEVAGEMGKCIHHTRMLLRRMNQFDGDRKLVHVCGWTETEKHCVPRPIYRTGPGIDAPPPLTRRGLPSKHGASKACASRAGIDLIAFAHVISLLRSCALSRQQLASTTGVDADTIGRLLVHMHDLALIHVERYLPAARGPAAKCFRWGDKPDAEPHVHAGRADTPRAPMNPRAGFSIFNCQA